MTAEMRERLAPSFAAQGWHDVSALAAIRESQSREGAHTLAAEDASTQAQESRAAMTPDDAARSVEDLASHASLEILSDALHIPLSSLSSFIWLLPLLALFCLFLLCQSRPNNALCAASQADSPQDVFRPWPHLMLWLGEDT